MAQLLKPWASEALRDEELAGRELIAERLVDEGVIRVQLCQRLARRVSDFWIF